MHESTGDVALVCAALGVDLVRGPEDPREAVRVAPEQDKGKRICPAMCVGVCGWVGVPEGKGGRESAWLESIQVMVEKVGAGMRARE